MKRGREAFLPSLVFRGYRFSDLGIYYWKLGFIGLLGFLYCGGVGGGGGFAPFTPA